MAVLKPPSAFMLPDSGILSVNSKSVLPSKESQTLIVDRKDVCFQTSPGGSMETSVSQLEQYVFDILAGRVDDEKLPGDGSVDVPFRPLWEALSNLGTAHMEQSEKVQKLSAAVHRTVPETLEQQRIVQNLEVEKANLSSQIDEMSETISLLEKRMECQNKVLAIQEKTLTTDGKQQKMLEAWRNKVLQMLVEKEMGNIEDKRVGFALQSQIEKLEKLCRKQEDEIELVINKNSDLLANLRLKDKHIQQITNELSIAKHSELKFDQLNIFINNTCTTLADNICNMGDNFEKFLPNQGVISEKLGLYEEQIERISDKLAVLQSLYSEKEKFYSEKLENLLIEHTQPLQPVPKSSASSQTELSWEEMERKISLLEEKLADQENKTSKLLVEKGVVSSHLAEAEAAKCDMKHELEHLRNQVNTLTDRHSTEVAALQKRESKAAIRAKHLERQVKKKEMELEGLEREFRERWQLETDKFQERISGLENENSSLRQALRKT